MIGRTPGMPFDAEMIAAEIALGRIPTERLPAVAHVAMEAGYDGPAVVRMAIVRSVVILSEIVVDVKKGRASI